MKTRYLTAKDGTKLAYWFNYVPNSSVVIILIHGLAEHKGRYVDFLKSLNSLGYTTLACDLRGHGESGGRRGDVKNFDKYLSDLDRFVAYVKKKHPELKIVLFGHSLGGLVATVYAGKSKKPDRLILSNPLLEAPQKTKLVRLLPYRLLGFIRVKKKHSESQEMLEYSYNDPLASVYFTLRLLGVIFHEGIRAFRRNSEKVVLPILILGGKLDPLLDPKKLDSLAKQFGSVEKTIKIYNKAKHRLAQSEEKDRLLRDLDAWIRKS